MLRRTSVICLGLVLSIALTGNSTFASQRTKLRDWRVANQKGYTPHVQKYVVVTPRAGVATGAHGDPNGGVQYPWQQTTLTAPAYPWGWFGARSHPESTRSRPYYDNYADWTSAGDY